MIRKLYKSIREYHKTTIAVIVFMILEVILEVAAIRFIGSLIDKGIEAGNKDLIIIYGLAVIGTAFLSLIIGILAGVVSAKASCGFAKNLRKDLYYKIQTFSFENLDHFESSSLITRLTTDINYVQNSFQLVTRLAIRSIALLVFAMFMVFRINYRIGLIYLVILPLLGLSIFILAKKAYPIFTRVFKKYDKLNNIVQENVRGIRVVKTFVREEHEKEKFNEVSEDIYKDFIAANSILALTAPIMNFFIFSTTVIVSWISAHIIVQSGGTAMGKGDYTSALMYTMQILAGLIMLSVVLVMLVISKASAIRISGVLDETPTMKTSDNPIKEIKNGDIEFKNVGFSYSNNKNNLCLSNINLKIKSGQTIGIIGGIGSSKTSLVHLIPRLYDATVGEVLVSGNNVNEYDIKALRNSIGFVLQKNVLFSGTIEENIKWGNDNATIEEVIEACKIAQAHEFIEKIEDGYNHKLDQGGTNVSGGQRQRLCIARALIKKPKILILDDSTSAVDTKTDSKLRDSFKEFIPSITKIIIAQRISSIDNADQIIVLDNGKIHGLGTHEELLSNNEIYKDIYVSQREGSDDYE